MTEPLVLLPDMMCDARIFGPQIAELSASVPLMTAPLTGTEKLGEICRNVLRSAPERFALAGLGMGGVVALGMLREAPERVSRLALISTSPLQELPFSPMAYETMLVKLRARHFSDAAELLLADRLAAGPFQADVKSLLLDMVDALGADVFMEQLRAMQRRRDMQSVLRKYSGPALVLCGAQDGVIPVKRHQTVAEFLPDGVLEVIDTAGNVPTLEAPAEVTAALRAWLERPLMLRR